MKNQIGAGSYHGDGILKKDKLFGGIRRRTIGGFFLPFTVAGSKKVFLNHSLRLIVE